MHVSSVICFAICLSIQPCIIFAYEVFTFLFITKNNSIVFFWTRGITDDAIVIYVNGEDISTNKCAPQEQNIKQYHMEA